MKKFALLSILIFTLLASAAGAFQMNSGYYVGNGQARSITGLGFSPNLVIIKADTSVGRPVWATSDMNPGYTAFFEYGAQNDTGMITSLDPDGFSVAASGGNGVHVNVTGVRYTWIAFAGSGDGTFKVGSYSGDGNAGGQNITTVGFQPDLVWLCDTLPNYTIWRSTSMEAGYSEYFRNVAPTTDRIKSFIANGFSVGGQNDVNQADHTYRYVAFKAGANCAVGSYEGNSTDDRNITSVGFKPDFVLTQVSTTSSYSYAVMRNNRNNGDWSHLMNAANNSVNEIQAFLSNGFQVGTGQANYQVNLTGQTYYYFAFNGVPADAHTGTYLFKTGTYSGNGSSQTISGVGFRPDLIFIKADFTQRAVFTTSMMPKDYTLYADAAGSIASGITELNSDGFKVGNSLYVNQGSPSTTYRWYAFGNAPCADFVLGAYTGNAEDNRPITGLGIDPDLVVVSDPSYATVWRNSPMTGDTSAFLTTTANTPDLIQAIGTGSFEVGTNLIVNRVNYLNYFFAFKQRAGWLKVGSYSGTGVAQTIGSLGGKPNWVWTKATNTEDPVHRGSTQTGDDTQFFRGVQNNSNRISALNPTSFDIGTDNDVNQNTVTYYYNTWLSTPTSLEFSVQPTGVEVSDPITPAPTVRIIDQFGNLVDYDNTTQVTISLSSNPGGATLSGTLTKTVSGGIAVFNDLSLDRSATGYVLQAAAAGFANKNSNSFNVGPGQGNRLGFIVQPTNTPAGSIITPTVEVAVKDNLGNIVTTDNSSQITLAILNDPAGGTLSGTLTRTVTSGVASFNDLSIDLMGSGYTLQATAPYYQSVSSEAFNITAEATTPTVVSYSPGSYGASIEAQVMVQFSKAMDRSSVENAFTLKAVRDDAGDVIDSAIAGTFSWPSHEAFQFTPGAVLKNNYVYRVNISAEARDPVGNRLASAFTFDFSTLCDNTLANTFVASDGRTKTTLPAGAFAGSYYVRISISPEVNPINIDPTKMANAGAKVAAEGNVFKYVLSGSAREFVAFDQQNARITTNFTGQATIVLPYNDIDNDGYVDGTSPPVKETNLAIYWLDETHNLWVKAPGSTVNTTGNYVSAPVGHFSAYALMVTPAVSAADVYAFPNPFKPSLGHTTVTFTNLPSICTIKVFTAAGDTVNTLNENSGTGQHVWNVLNSSGEPLQSGLYLYIVKSDTDSKTGKLVIIK